MYIAVVADNIALRKQTERLLDRANTALAPTIGTLYADSFGDETSFLNVCIKYDLFLLDLEPEHSVNLAKKLKDMQLPGVVAICKDAQAPFSYETAIQGIYTLDKPIMTAPLHKLITDAFHETDAKRKNLHLIEIRCELETHYVPKDDIIYAQYLEDQHKVRYVLTSGQSLIYSGSFLDMERSLSDYDNFQLKFKNTVINTAHIKEETKKSIQLSNGECFEYSLLSRLFSR